LLLTSSFDAEEEFVLVIRCGSRNHEVSLTVSLSVKYETSLDASAQFCTQQWRMSFAGFHEFSNQLDATVPQNKQICNGCIKPLPLSLL